MSLLRPAAGAACPPPPPARKAARCQCSAAARRRRKKKNSTSSSQVTQCRNSLNVILDISTDCVSQWDSCRLSTASGEGKCLLLGYMLQGLDCQFSESEWWLPPLWGQPLARSCARKRMRTRIKKMTRRGDAIAGNLKLFAWAGLWIKIFGIKKRTSGNFGDVSGQVLPSTTAEACIALLFVQSEDYIVNDSLFFRCQPIQSFFLHHSSLHQLRFQTTQSPQRRPTEVNA